jgi:hypothetical protein
MIHGSTTPRLSIEASSFLAGKGVFEVLDDFNYFKLYGFQGKPYLLPFYVSDKFFIVEVCRQYKYWAHFFNEKWKKQFISTSFENWRYYCQKTSPIWMNSLFILIISN